MTVLYIDVNVNKDDEMKSRSTGPHPRQPRCLWPLLASNDNNYYHALVTVTIKMKISVPGTNNCHSRWVLSIISAIVGDMPLHLFHMIFNSDLRSTVLAKNII